MKEIIKIYEDNILKADTKNKSQLILALVSFKELQSLCEDNGPEAQSYFENKWVKPYIADQQKDYGDKLINYLKAILPAEAVDEVFGNTF